VSGEVRGILRSVTSQKTNFNSTSRTKDFTRRVNPPSIFSWTRAPAMTPPPPPEQLSVLSGGDYSSQRSAAGVVCSNYVGTAYRHSIVGSSSSYPANSVQCTEGVALDFSRRVILINRYLFAPEEEFQARLRLGGYSRICQLGVVFTIYFTLILIVISSNKGGGYKNLYPLSRLRF
jgi:hypothetical protein